MEEVAVEERSFRLDSSFGFLTGVEIKSESTTSFRFPSDLEDEGTTAGVEIGAGVGIGLVGFLNDLLGGILLHPLQSERRESDRRLLNEIELV